MDESYLGQGIAKQLVLEIINNAESQRKKVIAENCFSSKESILFI